MIYETDDIDVLSAFAPTPVVSGLTDFQTEAFYCPERFRCVLAGRQSGKSHLGAAWLLGGQAGEESLYFARQIKSAWQIMGSVFRDLNHAFGLGLTISYGKGTIVEPSGHVIHVSGIKDRNAADNLRGRKFRRVVGDESGAITSDLLKYTVEDVLQPTLLKWRGSLLLSGTPGIDPYGSYFHELTGDPESGVRGKWHTDHWTVYDNPHVPSEYIDEEILQKNGWTRDNPKFRREYCAAWVADQGSLIYDYTGHAEPVPDHGLTVLGVDFGVSPDHAAFVVLRQSSAPHIHCVRAFSLPNLNPLEVNRIVRDLQQTYHPSHIVADEGALGKGYALLGREQFFLDIEPAAKQHKVARIELLRGIIAAGQFHHCAGAEELLDEWKVLPWAIDRLGHHEKFSDDCSDACLYALSKMIQVASYAPPVDQRAAEVIEMARRRQSAMRSGARMGR